MAPPCPVPPPLAAVAPAPVPQARGPQPRVSPASDASPPVQPPLRLEPGLGRIRSGALDTHCNRLLRDLLRRRLPPNVATRHLFAAAPCAEAQELAFAMTVTAGQLEELRLARSEGALDTWRRVSCWVSLAHPDADGQPPDTRLAGTLHELYRAISLLGAGIFLLRRRTGREVYGRDLLAFWRTLEDRFF
jgi:hypothetical protein